MTSVTPTNTESSKAPSSLSDAASSSRDVILTAAERLILEHGYQKASIAEICRRSGLPVGSVYHFFGSKAGILVAVLESRNALL
ncbi:MAG: TetR/AcrR family transcriptional regulator, partial [Comamonadaceae bacterium]